MSQELKSALVAGVVSLAVALLVSFNGESQPKLGGTVENFPTRFTNGLFAGPTDQLSVDSSGNLSTSGTLTSGALASTGSSSFAGLLVTNDAWFGASAASGSLGDVTIMDSTATASLIFDSGGAVGSCIEMRSTTGAKVYARVVGTTWTVTSVSCK